MLARIMRHEWRLLVSDRTPWILLVLFGIALAYGVTNGARWTAFQERAILDAQLEQEQRIRMSARRARDLERQEQPMAAVVDPRNPDAVGRNFGAPYAVLPPLPLAAISIGQSDLLPYYVRVTSEPRQTLMALGELENPHRLLAGRFDLAFVIIYLLPLLVIALGYNLVSGEKERGTLALMLSQPVRLGSLLASKIGFRALLLAAVVLAVAGIALAAGAVRVPDGDAAVRVLLWLMVVAAYGVFWLTLVIAFTALGRGSATNALGLTGIWLVLVLIVPSTLNLAAGTVHPMPSRVEMIQALRTAADEAEAQGGGLLAGYFEDHPELAGAITEDAMEEFMLTRLLVAQDVERRVRPVLQRYDEQLAAQQALVDRFRFFSPAVVMLEALNDIAGTGVARHRHFSARVSEFHQEWQAHFATLIENGERVLVYDELPRFEYREEALGTAVSRTVVNALALLVPALLLGFVGLRRMARYPLIG